MKWHKHSDIDLVIGLCLHQVNAIIQAMSKFRETITILLFLVSYVERFIAAVSYAGQEELVAEKLVLISQTH